MTAYQKLTIILLGDFNAKIGREDMYRQTNEKYSLHKESNDNGLRLINLAIAKDLVINSTTFMRKDIHKQTWTSPDGRTRNQINHILIQRRFRSSILDVRSYRRADCSSNHYMVGSKMKIKLNSNYFTTNKRQPMTNIDKLKDNTIRLEYANKIDSVLKSI